MQKDLRVLIVEDSESDAQSLIRRLQAAGFNPLWERVNSKKSLRAALAGPAWDIVFSDHSILGLDSREALKLVRDRSPAVPFIVVSGGLSDEEAAALMRHGAQDCIHKNHPARLIPVVERELRAAGVRAQQQRTEATLRQSESLAAIAGRVARLGGWTIELPERQLTWSEETRVIHEVPPDYQPTLEEGLALFPPEAREQIVRHVEACAREGTPYDFEVPKFTARGRRIWVRCIGEAVRDAEGRIIRLQGAFQDVTASKEVQLEVARSNRALRLHSACGQALVHAKHEADLLAEVCRLAVDLGGYRLAWVSYAQQDEARTLQLVAQAGAKPGDQVNGPCAWTKAEVGGCGPVAAALRTGQAAVCADLAANDTDAPGRAEALAWGCRSLICLPLLEGRRPFGLLGLYSGALQQPDADELRLLQDLADDLAFGISNLRTRAERRKAQLEIAWNAALLDKATDAIYVHDIEQRIVFWSRGAERIYGWKAEAALGRSVREVMFVEPTDLEGALQTVRQRGEWVGELQKRTRTGEKIIVDCRWSLVPEEAGTPQRVLAIETNVTEKKKLETQFFRAQRLESIGTLAGGIAHDLNNTLAPILMSVELLKEYVAGEEGRAMLATLQKSAQRGAELVRQVLSFARGLQVRRVPINLLGTLRDISVVVRNTFPKNIHFTLEASPDLWSVTGDPTQLNQVIMNLCVNARDAMPDGGQLSLSLKNVMLDQTSVGPTSGSKPGPYAIVAVTDTGQGIGPEVRERLFEPFFTTKEPGRGTGLGLSTALAIVRSHGGFIQVCSQPGQGSTFAVYLPADTAVRVGEDQPGLPALLPRGHGELVLVVDDEEAIRKMACQVLERSGYRVLIAADGAEAVALYGRHRPEVAVVLTDIDMPVMDGPATIAALKTMDPHVKVIGSTGLESSPGVSKAAAAGVEHFVSKPYRAESLLNILHQVLRSGQSVAPGPPRP